MTEALVMIPLVILLAVVVAIAVLNIWKEIKK